ncbi:protein of unknown function [Thermomonospora echinospora]|uniref:DUF1996 domain-containing protein n=1 Tax=Thermomonospora echinospora TaxID=1992 RepID=A0A1H5XH18_9ACTN|nr:DUF1996 domain-containing protein [Thermomonospora echinospora]SEG11031.1 protein of unknown function [Thermomonospora echinospora]
MRDSRRTRPTWRATVLTAGAGLLLAALPPHVPAAAAGTPSPRPSTSSSGTPSPETDAPSPDPEASTPPQAGTPPAEATTPPQASTPPPGTAAPPQGGGLRPVESDFVDIRKVPRTVRQVRTGRGGSRGTFTSRCGRNENGHFNSDNFIVAPGVVNGAHHTHDYVGNLSADGFSTDESLAAAGTTCRRGDKSTYFWPVMRLRGANDTGQNDQSAADLNIGRIQTPATVSLQFRGNPRSRVTAMPRFLRIITGDAKAVTNGPLNARAAWTCTGFTDRVVTDKYPLCPRGSRVARVLDFPSCWDGRNTDSANHRTHVVFPDRRTGRCPTGTRAVPQLRMTLTYSFTLRRSQIRNGLVYALDSFPEQSHSPLTDHADFVNVMPNSLMRRAVDCINRGRRC